ncbi:MAG: AI-2E family transporter, partial [Solibacillus sp.]
KRGMPRWGSLTTIVLILIGVLTGLLLLVGSPVAEQVNNLVANTPTIAHQTEEAINYILNNWEYLPPQVGEFVETITSSIQNIAVV